MAEEDLPAVITSTSHECAVVFITIHIHLICFIIRNDERLTFLSFDVDPTGDIFEERSMRRICGELVCMFPVKICVDVCYRREKFGPCTL